MRLMTYLGLTPVFSMPAKAIYVDGGIQCYPSPSRVLADAVTTLDYWDVWDGWVAAYATVQIIGPSSTLGSAAAWYPADSAHAYANITPAPGGIYWFEGFHGAYYESSGIPEILDPGPNASWEVNGFQNFGPDYIAVIDWIINQVQTNIQSEQAPYTFCTLFANQQTMSIDVCGGGGPFTAYQTHDIWFDITYNAAFAGRGNASGLARP